MFLTSPGSFCQMKWSTDGIWRYSTFSGRLCRYLSSLSFVSSIGARQLLLTIVAKRVRESKFLCYFSPVKNCSSKKGNPGPRADHHPNSHCVLVLLGHSVDRLKYLLLVPHHQYALCCRLQYTLTDLLGIGVSAVFSCLPIDGSVSALTGTFRFLLINSSVFAICNSKDSPALSTFPSSVEFPCWEPWVASCAGSSNPDLSCPSSMINVTDCDRVKGGLLVHYKKKPFREHKDMMELKLWLYVIIIIFRLKCATALFFIWSHEKPHYSTHTQGFPRSNPRGVNTDMCIDKIIIVI